MKELFVLGGELSKRNALILTVVGLLGTFFIWQMGIYLGFIDPRVLPGPIAIMSSIPDLLERGLISEAWYSIKLNLMGFFFALLFAFPLGIFLGLSPLVRGLSLPFVKGFPYLPLTAMTILFVAWFGIYDEMKVSFLSFAIFVYLLPTITQKVMETPAVYVNTAKTLGASNWQLIWRVYIPSTIGRGWDDVVTLVGISWTYIIIAELINRTGGIGSMIFLTSDKLHRMDMTFALLFVLMNIGFTEDRLGRLVGKLLNPSRKGK